MQLFNTLIKRDIADKPQDDFKFDIQSKTLAFVLDKYSDNKFEKLAESTYITFLTRHKN